jgi:hypothetical protein
MRAKMSIVRLELPQARIKPLGGQGTGSIGHQFDLLPTVRVQKRTAGVLSGEGIDCPNLEWDETIDWYEPSATPVRMGGHRPAPPRMGGHRSPTAAPDAGQIQWKYVGQLRKNMYAENPTSNTFKSWHAYRYFWACNPPNTPTVELQACLKEPDPDKAAKHWIAQHGFEWKVPELTDRPAMGLAGGSGGGGGASLATGNTRRRVIYFNLGFEGFPIRMKFVQILESVNGKATIHKLVVGDLTRQQVENAQNLTRWRQQVGTPANYAP